MNRYIVLTSPKTLKQLTRKVGVTQQIAELQRLTKLKRVKKLPPIPF